jgi:predicted lysophospholipase L1 biosynthesis ABC-type transport system permease subunit
VFPPGLNNNPLNDGAALTPDGLDAVHQGENNEVITLTYPPGTDAAALEAALADQDGLSFNAFTEPQVPGSVRYVAESRDVAMAVGLFFVALGALALAHTMALSGRRRSGELAVLRTLGLDRRGVRLVLLCESLAIAVVALVIGVPAGLIAGRFVWRAVVDGLGAVADPAVPWRAMAIIVPLTLVLAALVALPPIRSVLRRRPAVALRAE